MKINLIKAVIAVGALSIAGACTQETSVTRNVTFQEIGQERALTQLSRKFMAETPYTVNFDFDQYDLDAEANARLDEQAAWILAHPEARFSVYGHTDLMGGNEYNQALGLNRAQMVVDYLVSKGVSAGRLEIKMTLGEEMPLVNVVAPNEENRRATTFVSGWMKVEREPRERSASRVTTPVSVPGTVTTGGPNDCQQEDDCTGGEGEEEETGPECRLSGGCQTEGEGEEENNEEETEEEQEEEEHEEEEEQEVRPDRVMEKEEEREERD